MQKKQRRPAVSGKGESAVKKRFSVLIVSTTREEMMTNGPQPRQFQGLVVPPPTQAPRNNRRPWRHPANDSTHRQRMVHRILNLCILRILNKNTTINGEKLRMLPKMAKAAELALYMSAASLEEYTNPQTLVPRLSALAAARISSEMRPSSNVPKKPQQL